MSDKDKNMVKYYKESLKHGGHWLENNNLNKKIIYKKKIVKKYFTIKKLSK